MRSSSRDSKIALLNSLLCPGLGQMYNGQVIKALLISFVYFVMTYLFLGPADNDVVYQLNLLFVAIILYVYALCDAIWIAKKYSSTYELKKSNKLFHYLLFVVCRINIRFFIFYGFGFTVFTMPTTANFPTINVGDNFVVDRNPYTDVEPYYGDMIAFTHKSEYNEESIIKAYRIVGLPRDRFSVKNNSAVINGKYEPAELVIDGIRVDDYSGNTYLRDKGIKNEYNIYKEFYPNDFIHFSAKNFTKAFQHPMEDMAAIEIPSQHYFVMGDNRDNAMDSRFIGLVKKDQIIGKIKEETISSHSIEPYLVLWFWSSELSDFFNINTRNGYLKIY